ncbi:MAG: MmcQ/YjbR family DNA-binding protein [Lachnospiraceae bacterium]|nr:MmcQ/YjbR family DNA-binding protein [Lachnospiraceae bacterium]
MDRQQVFSYVKQRYHTLPDYPWADQNAVLRHRNNQKWYALIMEVSREKLGLLDEGTVQIMNVKCDPALIGSLRTREGYHPAYHMNKENWISVRLDGSVPENEIQSLIDESYGLTAAKSNKLEGK